MADLPVNFKDDIMNSAMDGMRRWRIISHTDGTVSFVDATVYDQVGDEYGAAQINATNEAVNNLKNAQVETVDPMLATEEGFAADAKLTGDAIKELNANANAKIGFLSTNVLYGPIIVDPGKSSSYTANQNCYATVYLPAYAGGNATATIDDINVARQYEDNPNYASASTSLIPLRKGQTLKVTSTAAGFSSSYTIYEMI